MQVANEPDGVRRKALPVQHVSLSVNDFAATLEFYTRVLGFDTLPRPDFGIVGAWLMTGNGIQIHLIEHPGFVASAGPHLAFETADLAEEIAHLRAHGVRIDEPFEMNGGRQAFFYDPSGNQLELNQPASPADSF